MWQGGKQGRKRGGKKRERKGGKGGGGGERDRRRNREGLRVRHPEHGVHSAKVCHTKQPPFFPCPHCFSDILLYLPLPPSDRFDDLSALPVPSRVAYRLPALIGAADCGNDPIQRRMPVIRDLMRHCVILLTCWSWRMPLSKRHNGARGRGLCQAKWLSAILSPTSISIADVLCGPDERQRTNGRPGGRGSRRLGSFKGFSLPVFF